MTLAGQLFSVLGADGTVGRALCRYLTAQGARVQAFGRKDDGYLSRPLGHALYAIGLTADYAARPFDTVEAHTSLFARLLQGAAFDSMTYLSSTRLYDGGTSGREDAPLALSPQNPRHLYDLSKALGESLCLTAGRVNVRAARLAVVYDGDLEGENFLHDLIRRAGSAARLQLDSHPRVARDYVHMDDVCAALTVIATRGRHQIYNVASGVNVANAELFAALEKLTGCEISTTTKPDAPYVASPVVDVTAMTEELGMRPRQLMTALPGMIR